jgi:hypothetical protein
MQWAAATVYRESLDHGCALQQSSSRPPAQSTVVAYSGFLLQSRTQRPDATDGVGVETLYL